MPKHAPKRKASAGVKKATNRAMGRAELQDGPSTSRQRLSVSEDEASSPQEAAGMHAVLAELRRMSDKIDSIQEEQVSLRRDHDNMRLEVEQSGQEGQIQGLPLEPAVSGGSVVHPQAVRLVGELTGEGHSVTRFHPVVCHLDDKIRSRIWAKEAIDFKLLLDKSKQVQGPLKLQLELGENPTLVCNPESDSKKISRNDWLLAWNVFTAVYTSRHQNDIMGVHRHFERVFRLMQENQDWQGYDLAYRRSVQTGMLSWGEPDVDLYAQCRLHFVRHEQQGRQTPASRKGNPLPFPFRVPRGYCVKFNKYRCDASDCSYRHACFSCEGRHPRTLCPKDKQNYSGNSTPKQPSRLLPIDGNKN